MTLSRKPKPCSREGCDREAFGKLCNGHQAQMKRAHSVAVRHAARPKLPPVSDEARIMLYERQQEHCPYCGSWMPLTGAHVHHRKLRSQGGDNDLANLIMTHPLCHKAIHEDQASYGLGFMVRSYAEPADVPVFTRTPPVPHEFVSADGIYCDRCNLPLGNARHRVADAA